VQAVTESCEDLVGKAMAATPVDTGTLRASIHVESVEVSAFSVTGTVATGGEANEYAIYQHEGTSRGVPATKFLEGPLIAEAPVYRAALEAAARNAY
jgi:hypothetical protein